MLYCSELILERMLSLASHRTKEYFRLYRARVIENWTEYDLDAIYENVYITGSKIGVFYNKDSYSLATKKNLKGTEPPKLLPTRYMLEHRVLLVPPLNFFYEIFNRKLQQYFEADLINYNAQYWFEKHNPKRFMTFKETFAVLTLSELEAGFVVCMVPLVISIVWFCIEWIATLKDLVVVLLIFKCLFKVKDLEQTDHSAAMKKFFANLQKKIHQKKLFYEEVIAKRQKTCQTKAKLFFDA